MRLFYNVLFWDFLKLDFRGLILCVFIFQVIFKVELFANEQIKPIPNRSPASYVDAGREISVNLPSGESIDLERMGRLEFLVDKYYRFKPSEYIPLNLPEYSSDGRVILGKVLQRSLQTWVESSKNNQSMLHSQADFARNNLNTKTKEVPFPEGHKLRISVKPIYGLLSFRYEGFFSGSVNYYAPDQTASTELTHPYGQRTLFLNYLDNYLGNATTLGVRWGF